MNVGSGKDRRYRLLFVGDIAPGTLGEDNLLPTKDWLASLGFHRGVGNLETPLTTRGRPATKLVAWRSPPQAACLLRDLGIDVVSLANNHALDYGVEGLADSLETLAQAKVDVAGAGMGLDQAFAPVLMEFDYRTRVALVAVACTLPLGFPAREDRPGVAPIRVSTSYAFDPIDLQEEPGCSPTFIHTEADPDDVAQMCQRLAALKEKECVVIVSIHWGNAFQKRLAKYQRPLARALVEAGCDLIVGHHPHTFHGAEIMGSSVVLYSLGNFVMDAELVDQAHQGLPQGMATTWNMSPESLVVVVGVSDGIICDVEIHPVILDAQGIPRPLEGEQADAVLDEVEALSGGIRWHRKLAKAELTLG